MLCPLACVHGALRREQSLLGVRDEEREELLKVEISEPNLKKGQGSFRGRR